MRYGRKISEEEFIADIERIERAESGIDRDWEADIDERNTWERRNIPIDTRRDPRED